MTPDYDVLIVGAGMVGAAVACALGQAGFKVGIVDHQPPAEFQPDAAPDLRVSALSPATIRVLERLGAWQHIETMRVCPYRRMAVWEKLNIPLIGKHTRFNRTMFQASELNEPRLGYIVENNIVQLGLHAAMKSSQDVELICPARITTILTGSKQPQLQLEDGRTLTARLLVGADGAQSQVRDAAGMGVGAYDYAQQALVATVEIGGGPLDITWQAFTSTGPLALLPLPDVNGRSYASLVWYNLPNEVRKLKSMHESVFLKAVREHFPSELPALKALHGRASFPLTRRHAQQYVKPGVALVGDAAHTINPLAGQGVNLGFMDVAWLAQTLSEARDQGADYASAEVLKRYEKARRTDNRNMMLVMDAFYHLFSNEVTPLKVARNIGLAVAGRTRAGQKRVMRYAMGLEGRLPLLAQATR